MAHPEKKTVSTIILADFLAAMAMSCEGLAAMWEGTSGVRRRVLNGLLLEYPASQKWCQPTRENAKLNGEVLLPCLSLLSEAPDFHLPHLPPLQAEIQTLYSAMGKEVSSKTIYKNAVEIKKLLSFLKRRANHKEVTKDPIFQKKYVILIVGGLQVLSTNPDRITDKYCLQYILFQIGSLTNSMQIKYV